MIDGLTVFHLSGAGASARAMDAWDALLQAAPEPSWRLATCQRHLLVTQRFHPMPERADAVLPAGIEVFEGVDAYTFLLEVATGLASEIAGETNILGQLKEAWCQPSAECTWLQWLLADAKEIRARHLSEVGGACYGRLVRQLLRSRRIGNGPVVVVGAGDMAETICPWLAPSPVRLLNRTSSRAEALAAQLRTQRGLEIECVPEAQSESAWKSAVAVVVCVPLDAVEDAHRIGWIQSRAACPWVLHLGVHRAQAGPWRSLPDFRCLDDLYALRRKADEHRDRQLARASLACVERARHRLLGASLSHPHGWEDLPSFFPRNTLVTAWPATIRSDGVTIPQALAA